MVSWESVGSVCSPFELRDRALGKRRIAREIVRIEDRAHAAQRVPGDGGDLGLSGTSNSEPRHGSAAQIMEREPEEANSLAGATPGSLEPCARPWLAIAFDEDDRRKLRRGVERGFERGADRDDDARAGLSLPQPNMRAVIGRPRQAQQIALPLSSPQREQQRQMEMCRRAFEKSR